MGGFGQLESLRAEVAKGKPRGGVSGFGRYHGRWCITSINDNRSLFFADGAPRKVEFWIELVHYGRGRRPTLRRLYATLRARTRSLMFGQTVCRATRRSYSLCRLIQNSAVIPK